MIRLKDLLIEQPEDPTQLSQVNLTSDRTFKDPNLQKIYDQYRSFVKELDALHQQYGHNVKHRFPISTQPTKSDLQNLLSSVKKQLQDDRQMFEKAYEYSAYIPKPYWTNNNLTVWDLINSSKGLAAMRAHYDMLPDRVFMDYYDTFGKHVDQNVKDLTPEELAELRKKWKIFRLLKDADLVDVYRIMLTDAMFPELLKCWSSGWDCFINGETHGIRTFLYSWTGVGAVGLAGFDPIGVIGIEIAYCLLIIDDVKRMSDGSLDIGTSLFNLFFDILGVLTVGKTGIIGKVIKTEAIALGKLLNKLWGQGAEKIRLALRGGFNLKKLTELDEIVIMLRKLGNTYLENLKTLCDDIIKGASYLKDILKNEIRKEIDSLYRSYPWIYPYMEPVVEVIGIMINKAETFLSDAIDLSAVLQKIINEYLSGVLRPNQKTVTEESYIKLKPILSNVKIT
jgi:hypothetical protein